MIEWIGANSWNGEGSQPSALANVGKRELRTGRRHQCGGSAGPGVDGRRPEREEILLGLVGRIFVDALVASEAPADRSGVGLPPFRAVTLQTINAVGQLPSAALVFRLVDAR
jgi:hypothetical protein